MGQLSLFCEETVQDVPVKDAAARVGVSVATINNWIHEGLLSSTSRGNVTLNSLEDIISNAIGKTKLTSRANKQRKDSHDHLQLCETIANSIDQEKDGASIALEYECSLSESYRNREGIYYTPKAIVDDMFKHIKGDVSDKTFLEPCCGGGEFVLAALKRGFRPENIYAFDTDPNAIAITKYRVKSVTNTRWQNIVCGDFLRVGKTLDIRFDYIFTNPPWGKKLRKEEKAELAWNYQAGGSIDTCSLFVAASISLLKIEGVLGFLLPASFFNVSTFADIRKRVLEYNIVGISDYGKFGSLLTNACSLVLSNTAPKEDVVCEKGGRRCVRQQSSFAKFPKHIINHATSAEDDAVISYIYSLPHCTLYGNAHWALGIVTGDNKQVLKSVCGESDVPIYRGRDIRKDGLCHSGLYIDRDLSQCRQVAPMDYYLASEKVVYRFISDRIMCFLDTRQSYILNSANMFIVDENFSMSNRQVVDMLDSDLMTWIYQSVFGTFKMLRSNLEQLPLFPDYYEKHSVFNEDDFLSYLNIFRTNGTYRIKG